MSLWARFTAWWEAGKAARKASVARKQQDRAEAILAGASTLGYGAYLSGYHGSSSDHGSSGTDCGPGVSGDCSGTGV
jgi:hypothetical protein